MLVSRELIKVQDKVFIVDIREEMRASDALPWLPFLNEANEARG
jgi:hypothetical protein